MRSRKVTLSILLVLILGCVPSVALAINFTISVNDNIVAQTGGEGEVPSCLVPPGETSCTATASIPPVEIDGLVTILEGGVVEAKAEADNTGGEGEIPGVINSLKVTGLALLYTGVGQGTIEISYGNRFPLPYGVWSTAGTGGFYCTASDGTMNPDVEGEFICRSYGYTATGSFCRVDASGDCLTANPDIAGMTESVTFEKYEEQQNPDIGAGISYTVSPGGVSNNEFFPATKVGVVEQNVACDALFNNETPSALSESVLSTCSAVETLNPKLVFNLQPMDAIFLMASPISIGAPSPEIVSRRLKSFYHEIDIQPIYDPNNNDINLSSNGRRQVAVIATKDFDPKTIVPGSVLLSVGRGTGVPPVGPPRLLDVNKDGLRDAVFTFSIPDLAHADADCTPPVAVLTGKTSTSTSGTGTTPQVETLDFSGSQIFKCAPPAGRAAAGRR